MPQIPRDPSLDSTVALFREGYFFISNRCQRYRSEIFQTRLLLKPTLCLLGEEAARLFYDKERFTREQAAPLMLQKTLLGVDGIQSLEGDAHRLRKQMFMSFMTPAGIQSLLAISGNEWYTAVRRWSVVGGRIELLSEVQNLLCRAACSWAGVPLDDAQVEARRTELAGMIEGAGKPLFGHLRARRARRHAERWAIDLVRNQRRGSLGVPESSALWVISQFREPDGALLDERIAAVELLNLLRPIVAVAHFIVLGALTLHRYPNWRIRLTAEEELIEPYAQEVRRLYAFFPFIAARVREDFEWKGYRLEKGMRAMLDLFGTNRDPARWTRPHDFNPERFLHWTNNPFDFVSQGGGDHFVDHRCPGEWITIDLLKQGLRMLCRGMRYSVPAQDLRVPMNRMPMMPRSRFLIEQVQPANLDRALSPGTHSRTTR